MKLNTKISLILCILILLFSSACSNRGKVVPKEELSGATNPASTSTSDLTPEQKNDSVPVSTPNSAENNVQTSQPESPDTSYTVDNTPKLTFDVFFSENDTYSDDVGNTIDYSYALPSVGGIDTAYTKQINSDIEQIFKEYIEPELNNMKDKISLGTLSSSYTISDRNGIYSIMLNIRNDFGQDIYFCWNISEDGSEVTNEQLLTLCDIAGDDFLDSAYDLMEKYVTIPSGIDEGYIEMIKSVRERTLSDNNLNINMPMYIDENGDLCFIGRVYSLAGADYYDYSFNTGL